MSLNETPSSERIHIGFFGRTNAGKSSVVNALTAQDLSIVSEKRGTTTDPVRKAMELLPLGPVVIIDTPGLDDDETELGEKRVGRARRMLALCDIAVLVVDSVVGFSDEDAALVRELERRALPYVIAYNKTDLTGEREKPCGEKEIRISVKDAESIHALKERIAGLSVHVTKEQVLVRDLLEEGDTAVLVIPIDASAPKGRIILPQQLVMRDLLDAHAAFLTCQPEELADCIAKLSAAPKIVITDSQAFSQVVSQIGPDQLLTSFSILFARYRGDLKTLVRGAAGLKELKDGDRVLICEGCTHHRQCNDIGTVKLPRMIEKYSGAKSVYAFTSGGTFPEDLSPYRLVVHCGGCMLNEKEMKRRVSLCREQGVEIVNYGIAIACMNGILGRSLEAFPGIYSLLFEN